MQFKPNATPVRLVMDWPEYNEKKYLWLDNIDIMD